MRHGLVWIAAIAIPVLAGAGPAAAQVFRTDFESDPSAAGFYVPYPAGITTYVSYSPINSYYLSAYTPQLYSPLLTYPQGQYVEADYKALNPSGDQTGMRPIYDTGVGLIAPGTGWTSNSFIFRANGNQSDRMIFLAPVLASSSFIDDVLIRPIGRAQAAAVMDTNFATLMPKPYTYAPAPGYLANLPNSVGTLARGQAMKAVMVGDSIISDMAGSSFDAKAERRAGGTIDITYASVGGAGPTYWAQNNVAGNITPTTNMFMWGGISQTGDIASLRSIIQQVRAAKPNIEIVLMSPIAGTENNPFIDPTLLLPPDPNGTSWRSQLLQLAAQDGVQYWDLTTPWAQYIYNSGLQYDDFLRDGIHMNGRGEMLTAEIMQSFFNPVPEPSTLVLTGLAGAAVVAWRRRRHRAKLNERPTEKTA